MFSKEINMLEIVFMSRKRIMLFELGSLILNESLAKYLFGGFYELHKIFSERSKDKEIASKLYKLLHMIENEDVQTKF